MKIVSWKNVLNTAAGSKRWNGIDEARKYAQDIGYEYFSWNGWIYKTTGEKTEILTEQIDSWPVILRNYEL